MAKHILITGGCGYIGTVLTQQLLAEGHHVCVVDTHWFGNFLQPHERLKIITRDIRHLADYETELAAYPFDTVYHLASIANDPCCDLNPKLSWEVNVLATMQLAEWAKRVGVKHFIYASSGSVYGVNEALAVTEELPLTPISDYNKTKMIAERVLLSYQDDFLLHLIRPATVCGLSPRLRLDITVNMLTHQAMTNHVITVLGGEQTRPNLHIEDMVRLYVQLLEGKIAPGIYNAGVENLSVAEIAREIQAKTGCRIETHPSNDPRSYRLDASKLQSQGFNFTKGVDHAIEELVAYFGENNSIHGDAHHNVKWMKKQGVI